MKYYLLSITVISIFIGMSGFINGNSNNIEKKGYYKIQGLQPQSMNLFVTHGHCSSPFSAKVNKLNISAPYREDLGNPLENLKLSFQIDPNSFTKCRKEQSISKLKTSGLFINKDHDQIKFTSTNVYTMGMDWYQINGIMSIKGVEKEIKIFATGIRNPNESMSTALVLQGEVDLFDWGIDYDLIVNGESNSHPTKWMYLNMKVDLI
jgi:polyisoprenoid-binding protein YceI